MPPYDDKRRLRKLKRELKRAGNRKRRRQLQRIDAENAEDAPVEGFDILRYSTAGLNGADRDATRTNRSKRDSFS